MTRIWALLVAGLLSACASETRILPQQGEPSREIVWPQPPAEARIRYLYSFSSPSDLGYELPLMDRLKDFFGGATNHEMIRPYAIDVSDRHIAVADPGAGSVHIFDTQKQKYNTFDTVGRESLISPIGIALGDNRIFLSDSALNKVFVLDSEQQLIASLNHFERPTGLAYDSVSQRLYVADTRAHKIIVLDHQGREVLTIGERGKENGQFNYPSHIALANGHLYVNDTLNFRVQVFDLEGKHIHTFGIHGKGQGYIAQPKGLGVNDSGHIFLAEAVANRIQVFNLDGEFLLRFGSSGNESTAFRMPAGIVIAKGKIYVADSGNRRVQVFEYLGDD